MPKPNKLLRTLLYSAVVGAIIGTLFARNSHIPQPIQELFQFSPGMRLSLMLWLLFSIYWSIAAKDQAATKTSESVWSRQLHLILVNLALLLLVLNVPGLTWRFLPTNHLLVGVGLVIQGAFILMAVWARRSLGSNWSGEVRIAAEHQLVKSGPYRLIRHPIYTALLGMYCGTILVSGEIHAVLALMLVTAAYWRKLRLEERALTESFGESYNAYRRDTWALVPLLY